MLPEYRWTLPQQPHPLVAQNTLPSGRNCADEAMKPSVQPDVYTTAWPGSENTFR